jgi:hypothetical protein
MNNQGDYPYGSLYPYQNRSLGLSEHITEREFNMEPDTWALIAIANLMPHDTVIFPKGSVTIDSVSSDNINYTFLATGQTQGVQQVTHREGLQGSALFIGIKSLLESAYPDYSHPVCGIIERDPAVFRLQSKAGWVVNDKLCLSAGNVPYHQKKNGQNKDEKKELDSSSSLSHTGPEQGAFTF